MQLLHLLLSLLTKKNQGLNVTVIATQSGVIQARVRLVHLIATRYCSNQQITQAQGIVPAEAAEAAHWYKTHYTSNAPAKDKRQPHQHAARWVSRHARAIARL